MPRKPTKKSLRVERDPNPFMRVGGPFKDDSLPSTANRYLDLADIALGNKESDQKPRHKSRAATSSA